jgi:hypothetical protein
VAAFVGGFAGERIAERSRPPMVTTAPVAQLDPPAIADDFHPAKVEDFSKDNDPNACTFHDPGHDQWRRRRGMAASAVGLGSVIGGVLRGRAKPFADLVDGPERRADGHEGDEQGPERAAP